MFCKNCGNEILDNSAFCAKCGAPTAQQDFNSQQNFQQPPYGQQQPYAGEQKSKLVAGLLGLLIGAFGIHNFYLGNTGRGVLQIVLTIITAGLAGLWGFIEGILILCGNISTDANGVPLKD